MVWLFPSHMSSELHYHNIPDIKLKTVGTSIVDICTKFKELPVVSLIPAKLWLLPHSSFYNANFFSLSLSNTFTRSQPCNCKASCAVPVWAGHANSHTGERVPTGIWGVAALASLLFGITRNAECLEEVISGVQGIAFILSFTQHWEEISKS